MSTELTDILDGIYYKELKGSNVVNGDIGRIQATRVFRTAWNDRLAFVLKMIGEITLASDGSTVIVPPKAHPEFPGLFATGFSCEPYATGSKNIPKSTLSEIDDPIEYDFARVTIRYDAGSVRNDATLEIISRTEEVKVSAQIITIPGELFYYQGTTTPVAHAAGVIVGTVEDVVIFHRASTNKRATTKALSGKLNNATFLDSPSGSVMFMGADSHRNVNIYGSEFWELTYTFKTRILPGLSDQTDSWQKIMKQNGKWATIVWQSDDTKGPYEYGDMNSLFT